MIHILVETFTTTGFVGSKGTIVIFRAVFSVPGGIVTGLSGDDVILGTTGGTISAGVVAAPGATPPAAGVVAAPGAPGRTPAGVPPTPGATPPGVVAAPAGAGVVVCEKKKRFNCRSSTANYS